LNRAGRERAGEEADTEQGVKILLKWPFLSIPSMRSVLSLPTPPVRLKVAIERRNWPAALGEKPTLKNGNLHRLFLEQRHAVGLLEHRLQFTDG
jgi:hypothetical protein